MKKVLMTASTFGHFQSFHLPYLKALAQEGYSVTIACPMTEEITAPEGVHEMIHVPFRKKMFAFDNFKATSILRKRMSEFDLVICHTSLAAFFTRLSFVWKKKNAFVIHMAHGYLFHEHSSMIKKSIYVLAEKIVANQTDLVLTMNEYDKEMAKKYKLGKHVAGVHGVGLSCLQKKNVGDRSIDKQIENTENTGNIGNIGKEALKLPPTACLLVFGGEFSKRKNQTFLIEAMTKFPKNIHLALAGKGDLLEDCKQLVSRLGLHSRVHFLGFVNNLPQWYESADVVVSASVSEGLPFHLMEALTMGTPVVVSDVKGHRDLVEEGETGLLFPFGSQEMYVAQVLRLWENPLLGEEMVKKALPQMEQYQVDRVLPEVMKWYVKPLK